MNTIKNLGLIAFLFSLILVFPSCSDDDEMSSGDMNIAQLAADTDQLSILVSALDRADLVSVLEGDGPFTVFAPTNDAFSQLLSENGFSGLDDIPVEDLTSILLNHVITGEFNSGDLSTGYIQTNATEATTGNNINAYVNLASGVVINGESTVVSADIEASNGVIHIVDNVIELPTVVTFATVDNTFETLTAALTRNGLPTDFVNVLSGDGPFTVFAPTNEAFTDLLTELNASGLGDIDAATLDAVLKYHVVAGANVLSTSLTDDMMVETLANADFRIDLDNGAEIIDANDRVSDIIVTDVQASNGIVHVINKVILP